MFEIDYPFIRLICWAVAGLFYQTGWAPSATTGSQKIVDISHLYQIDKVDFNTGRPSQSKFVRAKSTYWAYKLSEKPFEFVLLTKRKLVGAKKKPLQALLPTNEKIRSKELCSLTETHGRLVCTPVLSNDRAAHVRFSLGDLAKQTDFFHLASPWSTRNYFVKCRVFHPLLQKENAHQFAFLFLKLPDDKACVYKQLLAYHRSDSSS